ncbi:MULTISPECIES: carbamate kinase [Exiguobacterium]|uniref:Carbamate kinase n=1 Tax=Exiguobacterium marinum TaxID=273528 RepID=A0ABY7X3K6_9BACL|nr:MULTISPECIES: carbamate kinase [Exiguobacterium]WDH75514.1 carbamate kinase [Exiguobacterium marinum]
MKKRIVIALGGNAILTDDGSAAAQRKAITETVRHIADLIEEGHEVVLSHGNGPQIGAILIQQQIADSEKTPAMDLGTCGAMTQGMIGYWFQQLLRNELSRRGMERQVVTMITQSEVEASDQAFTQPTKPIGPFYNEMEASHMRARGEVVVEDAGRGYRKVVASPKPVQIVEAPVIQDLLRAGHLVIAAGGGGVPVVREQYTLHGVDAVIDKDFAAAQLAQSIQATHLMIITGVPNVCLHFNQPNQEKLEEVTTSKLEQLIEENHFMAGSMLPKVEAALQFIQDDSEREAVITDISSLKGAIAGTAGTRIRYDFTAAGIVD